MFVGTYEHSLDGKGRVVLPSKFRNRLAQAAYLAPHQDVSHCGRRTSSPTWWAGSASGVRAGGESAEVLRGVSAYAEEVTPDAQGRILVPQHLRDFGDLGSEVVVTGAFDHIEL